MEYESFVYTEENTNIHLPVYVYVEPKKPSSETWIHLCGNHISMLSYLFIDP